MEVALQEREVMKTMDNQPIAVRGCPVGQRCVLTPAEVAVRAEGLARAVAALTEKPPVNLVFADVSGADPAAPVKLSVHPLPGVTLTLQPAVAKWSMLRESPPPPASPARQ